MFCPECGAPNEDDAVYCGNCGATMDPDAPVEVENQAPEEQPAEDVEEQFEEPEAVEELDLAELAPPTPPPPQSPPAGSALQTSGLAIASLVMGIAGWTILPLLASILAIIFGYMARNEIRQRPDQLTGDGLAVAGLVLGWLSVAVTVLVLCLGGLGACFFFGVLGSAGSY